MATKRLTAKDYKEDFEDAIVKLEVLRSRIKMRAITLCKRNPNIEIKLSRLIEPHKAGNVIKHFPHFLSDTSVAIEIIEQIEKELANRHPHKQTEIKFEDICNCDGRDMPVYEEEGKRWCPQCGYEVK